MMIHTMTMYKMMPIAGAVAAVLAFGSAAIGDGVERFWADPGDVGAPDGEFHDPTNWEDPDGQSGVPNAEDTAIFDLPMGYSVWFNEDALTDRVIIRRGFVRFELKSHTYDLPNSSVFTPAMVVGEQEGNTASLTVEDGAMSAAYLQLGAGPGAFGYLTVDGAPASINVATQLNVGNKGAGLLDIVDGAIVETWLGNVAHNAGSFGSALVAGSGSALHCEGGLTVGRAGYGELLIDDGAHVTSADGILGQIGSSYGEVKVRDVGSMWSVDGSLDVGMFGKGLLRVEDGATVAIAGFAVVGTFSNVPWNPGTAIRGEAIVRGEGAHWSVGTDLLVGFATNGELTVGRGGRVSAGGDIEVSAWNNCCGPQSQGHLVLELNDAGHYVDIPAIDVAGEAEAFTTATINLVDDFQPALGDLFRVVSAGLVTETYSFDLPDLPDGLAWSVEQTSTEVNLRVISAVPGDLTGDGSVGVPDLLIMINSWGTCDDCDNCPADLTGDCTVGIADLLILINNWG